MTNDIENQWLSVQKLTSYQHAMKQYWQRLKATLAPDLVLMAPPLNTQQIAYLFKKLDDKNAEQKEAIEERLALSSKQQKNAALKRYNKALTRWLGIKTTEQEALIVQLYSALQPQRRLVA